jgi:4-aminobutyrate aminotransferase-like enzyme
VALANIAIIEREGLVERSLVLGRRLLDGLKTLMEFPCVGDVRGLGLMCGVEIVSDRAHKTADAAMAGRIYEQALELGLRTRAVGASTLAFAPPLVISEHEVDTIVSTLRNAMRRAQG